VQWYDLIARCEMVQIKLEQDEKDAAIRTAQLTQDSLAAEQARVPLA